MEPKGDRPHLSVRTRESTVPSGSCPDQWFLCSAVRRRLASFVEDEYIHPSFPQVSLCSRSSRLRLYRVGRQKYRICPLGGGKNLVDPLVLRVMVNKI